MKTLAIDPGETVGWAIFEDCRKTCGGQMDWLLFRDELARSLGVGHWRTVQSLDELTGMFMGIDRIVMEDFLIYPEDVGPGPPPPWDPVITLRLIGAIQAFADIAGVPVDYQGADIKTSAEAAGAEGDFAHPLYENRHENDATRHGTYDCAQRFGADLPDDGISFV